MNRLPREVTDELREILRRRPEPSPPPPGLNREALWQESLSSWRSRGLEVRHDPAQAQTWVEFYGCTIPGAIMSRQHNGKIRRQNRETETVNPPPGDWTPPLQLPGKGTDLTGFVQKNRGRQSPESRCSLTRHIQDIARQMLERKPDIDQPAARLAAPGQIPETIEAQWGELTVSMMAPQALTRLKKWTGQEVKRHLQNYNLAIKRGGFLEEMAQSNPGALAGMPPNDRNGKKMTSPKASAGWAPSPSATSPAPSPPRTEAAEERQRLFNNLPDYVSAEPQTAARATAWSGLLKASAEWHSDARLRREREALAGPGAKTPASPPWNPPTASTPGC